MEITTTDQFEATDGCTLSLHIQGNTVSIDMKDGDVDCGAVTFSAQDFEQISKAVHAHQAAARAVEGFARAAE